jgi:hypothetical protein
MRTTTLSAALLLAALPLAARAQGGARPPQAIPTVVVSFALGMFDYSGQEVARQFTVGRAPSGWPAELLPATTVVGGSTHGFARTLVMSYPRSANGHAPYAAQLLRQGYRLRDTTKMRPLEGFISSREVLRWMGALYCADSARAVLVVPIDSTKSTRHYGVTLIANTGGFVEACTSRLRDWSTFGMTSEVALRVPPLAAPLGATIRPQGTSTGRGPSGDMFDARVEADTALSPAALAAHYGAELARAGWTLTEPASTSHRQALQPLSAKDRDGAEWRGALVISTVLGKNRINLVMEQADP